MNRDKYYKTHGIPNCKCVICGKPMYIRPSRLCKLKHGATCSLKCGAKNRSIWFKGENNHQFGLKGNLNPTFKSDKKITNYGYIMIRSLSHPFRNKNDFVFEHRLVIEANADKFNDKYFTIINGKKYLKKEYEVHHKNEIKTDNRIENLAILTKIEHRRLHNSQCKIIRNRYGQIVALLKNGTPIPVKIKLFENGKIPTRQTAGAACFDCYSSEKIVIPKGERKKISLGFAIQLPYSFEALIRPRSGLSLKGIDCALGTIDEDFRSSISAILINNSDKNFQVNIGDRICQLAIRQYEICHFKVVNTLDETERGENGFGSTGV